MLIEKIIGRIDEISIKGRTVDPVLLLHDDLLRPHQKVISQGGRQAKISLPHGDNLFCGAVLYVDEELIIFVDMPEEKVFEIYPKTNIQWAKAAFNIGNMHQKAYLYEDCIRVPYDYVLEKVIDGLGIKYAIDMKKLDGLPANAPSGAHSHSHGNEHVHEHQ